MAEGEQKEKERGGMGEREGGRKAEGRTYITFVRTLPSPPTFARNPFLLTLGGWPTQHPSPPLPQPQSIVSYSLGLLVKELSNLQSGAKRLKHNTLVTALFD